MKLTYITALLILSISTDMISQDLSGYQWENRILLILTEDINDPEVGKQISEIVSSEDEMTKRKLEFFLITKDKSYQGKNLDETFNNYNLFRKYKVTTAPYELVLIGLDGGVKERYTEYTPLTGIFGLIDGMPMRKSELRKKKE